jgi:hypothetical protein
LSAVDIDTGLRRIRTLAISGDGKIHFRRWTGHGHEQVTITSPAKLGSVISLTWLTGSMLHEILKLRKDDIRVTSDGPRGSLVIRWHDRGEVAYPSDQYTEEACSTIVGYLSTLEDGAQLFPGRSKGYGRAGENPLANLWSISAVWLALRGVYPSWTSRYIRLSAIFRLWETGGFEEVTRATGLIAQSAIRSGNRYVIARWKAQQALAHPAPTFVEVNM